MKIALVGAGNLLESLLVGALRSGVPADWLMCSTRTTERAQALAGAHDVACTTSNQACVDEAHVVIIGVPPDALDATLAEVADDLRPGAVVAVATVPATLAQLEAALPGVAGVRIVPSVNARVRHGICALARGSRVSDDQLGLVLTLLGAMGEVIETDEAGLDAIGSLAGSGPAYLAAATRALADGGVELGLPEQEAWRLACATLSGTAANLTGEVALELPDDVRASAGGVGPLTAAELEQAVGHPGGSTARSLAHLRGSGALAALTAAVTHHGVD